MICRDCVGSGEDDVYGGRCRVCGGIGEIRLTVPMPKPQAVKPKTENPRGPFIGNRIVRQHWHWLVLPVYQNDPIPAWAIGEKIYRPKVDPLPY